MKERMPAEGFPPGELIKEELEVRGWMQDDLAEILGRTKTAINEVITGKRGITVDTAKGLGEAFGTGAEFWLNMESAYRLSLQKTTKIDICAEELARAMREDYIRDPQGRVVRAKHAARVRCMRRKK